MIDIQKLINIPDLFLKSKLILKGYYSGIHRIPFKGLSSEFSQYREYVSGDDFDKIDWKVFLRSEKFFIKESEREVNTDLFIMYDISKSMNFGKKPIYGSNLLFLLSFIAYNQGDNIGYCFFNDTVKLFIKPSFNKRILFDLSSHINDIKYNGKTNMKDTIINTIERLRKNTFFILISDLAVEDMYFLNILKGIRKAGNDVIVFHIIDEKELSKEILDNTILRDNETGEIEPSESYRIRVQAIRKKHNLIKINCIENSIDYVKFTTEQDFYEALNRFFFRRR